MGYVYDYKKAAECVAFFTEREGGEIEILKLLKLLYISDRTSIAGRGFPITGDRFAALPHGPILSCTYDGLKTPPDWPEMNEEERFWTDHFVRVHQKWVALTKPVAPSTLAPAEIALLQEVWQSYGHLSASQLRNLTHTFQEWQLNVNGRSSHPIDVDDVLRALGQEERIQAVHQRIREERYFDSLFAGTPTS